MAKSQHERERKRIRRFFRAWRDRLYLHDWEVALVFEDGEFVSPDGAASGEAVATCHARWQYRHATMTFNTQRAAQMTDAALERCVIHEAMHIHLNEMRFYDEGGLPHEERVATTLAQAIQWAYEAGMKACR